MYLHRPAHGQVGTEIAPPPPTSAAWWCKGDNQRENMHWLSQQTGGVWMHCRRYMWHRVLQDTFSAGTAYQRAGTYVCTLGLHGSGVTWGASGHIQCWDSLSKSWYALATSLHLHSETSRLSKITLPTSRPGWQSRHGVMMVSSNKQAQTTMTNSQIWQKLISSFLR